jgi:MFS transporter, ACS family, D-galactonate transporter
MYATMAAAQRAANTKNRTLAYAIFQLPGGWFANRWGTRIALPLMAITWSAATAGLGFGWGLWSLAAFQFLNGTAQAGLFPGSVNTISKWFPPERRAFPSGALGGFMSVGGAITTSVTAALLFVLDWRAVFVLLSVFGVIWAVAFYVWFRNTPQEHSWVNADELALIHSGTAPPPAALPTSTPWLTLLTSRQMWLIGSQQFFRSAGYVFYQTWMPKFLQQTRGVSTQDSGFMTSVTLTGVVLGCTLGGLIADWVLKVTGSRRMARQGIAISGLVLCSAFVFVAYFISDPWWTAIIMGCGAFCAGAAGPAGYTITMDVGGKHVSTIFSTMNMAGNVGGFLSPLLVAWLVDVTNQNWNAVLLLFAGIYLGGAFCWVWINPHRPIVPETAEST